LEVCIKEEYIYLGERGLVLVGLLQPLVPFFVQILTRRTVEKYYILMAKTSRSLGNDHVQIHHPLEVCIKEEDIYLGERGLVLVGLLQPPVPLFIHILTRTVEKYYVLMVTTSRSLGN
jgi:hypothetical protein